MFTYVCVFIYTYSICTFIQTHTHPQQCNYISVFTGCKVYYEIPMKRMEEEPKSGIFSIDYMLTLENND